MNIKKLVKVGDIFPNVTKLLYKCGFPKANCSVKKSYINQIKCYLSYEKTGKINSKTHKVSNEIIITEVFDTPKENTHTVKDNGKRPMYYPLLRKAIEPLSGTVSNSDIYCKTLGFDYALLYPNYKDKDIDNGIFAYNYKLRNLLSNAVKSTCDQIKKRNVFYDYDKGIIIWNNSEWEESKHFIIKDSDEDIKFKELQYDSAEKVITDKGLEIPLYHKDKTKMEVNKLENYLVNYKFVDVYSDYNKELISKLKESFGCNKYCRGIYFGGKEKETNITRKHSDVCNMNLWSEKEEFLDLMEDKMKHWIEQQKNCSSAIKAHHKKMFKLQFTNEDEYFDYLDRKVDKGMKIEHKEEVVEDSENPFATNNIEDEDDEDEDETTETNKNKDWKWNGEENPF